MVPFAPVSPTTKKVLIVLSVLLAGLVLGCVVFAFVGASWLEQWATGMQEQGEQADAEARAFAAGRDQEQRIRR